MRFCFSLKVTFVGKGAVDNSGPRREFFWLLATEAQRIFFSGSQDYKFFDSNVSAIQVTVCWMHYDVLYCATQMYVGKRSLQSRGTHSNVNHKRRKWISIVG